MTLSYHTAERKARRKFHTVLLGRINSVGIQRKGAKRPRRSAAEPKPNLFGLRREAKRHAALEVATTVQKRCRRCALPPQSKIGL
jgi:hypothetical protein